MMLFALSSRVSSIFCSILACSAILKASTTAIGHGSFAASVDEQNVLATARSSNHAAEAKQWIQEIASDESDLHHFYLISFSPTRIQKLGEYFTQRYNEFVVRFHGTWEGHDVDERIDLYGSFSLCSLLLLISILSRHLIRRYITWKQDHFRSEWNRTQGLEPLLGSWAPGLIGLCEKRQAAVRVDFKDAANTLSDSRKAVQALAEKIMSGKLGSNVDHFTAYRAVSAIEELLGHLQEWQEFYSTYDPMFDWWVMAEWVPLLSQLRLLGATIREHLVGIDPGDADAIFGQPSGRDSILKDLNAEVVPYSPEEIIKIGEKEYQWCEKEMFKTSRELGYGNDWRAALEHVKQMYVDPGEQIYLVHELANEAVGYVTKYDMVTIPSIANTTWRTYMMSPGRQKVNPFFLGGTYIQVSYPTNTMSFEDKMMIMRGNNRHFSRSTVFHELLPGHHLQYYYMDRYNTHRRTFTTPFWIEGWSFYWEMILWDRGFPSTPENKIGMLFWRMHRALRIIFSLKFHLGEMTPQECVDLLVEKGAHERATAEGEVRRSFNGDYSPLYQAGYMLGALQFYALRKEIVDSGKMGEKEFHDRILREGNMPVEMVRAMLKGEKLAWDFKPSWKFYDLVENARSGS